MTRPSFIRQLSLPLLLASLALTLLAWYAAGSFLFGLTFGETSGARAFVIYYAGMLVVAALWFLRSARQKASGAVLAAGGLLVLLVYGAILHGYRFDGRVDLGKDEEFSRYTEMRVGAWTRPPDLPLRATDIDPEGGGSCTIRIAGNEVELAVGRKYAWNGLQFELQGISQAPWFSLTRDGRELDSGYLKLDLSDPTGSYFLPGTTPYRFYLSRSGDTVPQWELVEGAWTLRDAPGGARTSEGKTPADVRGAYHLRVLRGKLTVLDRVLGRDEVARFDGYEFRLGQEAPWISLKVSSVRRWYVLLAGGLLVLGGGLLQLRSGKGPW